MRNDYSTFEPIPFERPRDSVIKNRRQIWWFFHNNPARANYIRPALWGERCLLKPSSRRAVILACHAGDETLSVGIRCLSVPESVLDFCRTDRGEDVARVLINVLGGICRNSGAWIDLIGLNDGKIVSLPEAREFGLCNGMVG
jgi:hypothetical protein